MRKGKTFGSYSTKKGRKSHDARTPFSPVGDARTPGPGAYFRNDQKKIAFKKLVKEHLNSEHPQEGPPEAPFNSTSL